MKPITKPITTPPITCVPNVRNVSTTEILLADSLVIPNVVTKRISPTASLNIDSPDIMVANFGGIFDFVIIAPTAIGVSRGNKCTKNKAINKRNINMQQISRSKEQPSKYTCRNHYPERAQYIKTGLRNAFSF